MNLDRALTQLAGNPSAPLDLAELALLLALDEYPHLKVAAYLKKIESMAQEARALLNGDLTARVRSLCGYLFDDVGFRGTKPGRDDACRSYFNEVLDRRRGTPLALSAVVMAIGRRAGLTLSVVRLSEQFVVKATAGAEAVLFDPFRRGRLLAALAGDTLVEPGTGRPFAATTEAFEEVPLGEILLCMLTYWKMLYLNAGDLPRSLRVIARLRQLVPDDPLQVRDLGGAYYQAGEYGQAIGPLEWYLREVPQAEDRDIVSQVLALAKAQVGRWN